MKRAEKKIREALERECESLGQMPWNADCPLSLYQNGEAKGFIFGLQYALMMLKEWK